MAIQFTKAVKLDAKARIALIGVSGSGKTYGALRLATSLVPEGKVAVIDTEAGSASKYADLFDFCKVELTTFHPQKYIEAILAAESAGFDVLVIDSLSHAWFGKDGELELVDKKASASKSRNSYFAWRDITPLHNRLIDTILQSKIHIIATMRSKAEYIIEDVKGKQVPKKVGMAPVMRDGVEYEFDMTFDLDSEHNAVVSKTRCIALDGQVYSPLTEETGRIIQSWLKGESLPELDQSIVTKGRELTQQLIDSNVYPSSKLAAYEEMIRVQYYRKNGNAPQLVTPEILQKIVDSLQEKVNRLHDTPPISEPTDNFIPDPACQLDPDCQRYAWEVEQHGSDIMRAAMQDAVTAGDEDKIAEIYASHQTRLRQA